MLEIFGNGALSLARATGGVVGSGRRHVQACFYCFFQSLQILASAHEIVKLSAVWSDFFSFFAFILFDNIVGGHYFFCADFKFVGGLDFDEVALG